MCVISDIVVTAVRVDYSNVKASAIPVQVHTMAALEQLEGDDGGLFVAWTRLSELVGSGRPTEDYREAAMVRILAVGNRR